jgi:hypothetical protein
MTRKKEPILPVIKKEDLIHGAYYRGTCRNANLARWDVDNEVFWHWRYKFGDMFTEQIKCPEDEDHYDVFVADKLVYIQDVTEDDAIPLKYMNK